MAYHYVESGLDNIYLVDGFTIHDTPYGKGVSVKDTAGLHRAIGRWIVATPKPIAGAELRFIRLEMEITQRNLAAILNATEQTLRLWEKHRTKPIPGTADRLLRALYLDFQGGDGSVRKMLARLADLDQIDATKVYGRPTSHGWEMSLQ